MLSTTEFKKICTHKHQPYLFVPLSSSSFKVWQECSYNTLVEKKYQKTKRTRLEMVGQYIVIGYERQCQINTCSDTEQIGYLNFVFK